MTCASTARDPPRARSCVWVGATETGWRLWITTRQLVGPRLRLLLISWVKTLRELRTIHSPSREPTTGTTWAHTACARCTTIWRAARFGLPICDRSAEVGLAGLSIVLWTR